MDNLKKFDRIELDLKGNEEDSRLMHKKTQDYFFGRRRTLHKLVYRTWPIRTIWTDKVYISSSEIQGRRGEVCNKKNGKTDKYNWSRMAANNTFNENKVQ